MKRMKFIPELQDMIRTNLINQGVPSTIIQEALDIWHAGNDPRSPLHTACFAVFTELQNHIRRDQHESTDR